MKKFILLFIFCPLFLFAQGKLSENNYRIYSVKQAKEVSLNDIAEEMNNYDVLFFGEEHNDSVAHYLEQTMLELLYAKFGADLALSMEMFDRDVQTVMDEYLKGFIREKNFKKDARVWSNYRDYRSMVEFAKEKKLDVICANAPGRYNNLAGRKGQKALMELTDEAKKYFAPLPYDTAIGIYYEKLMALTSHTPDTTKDTSKIKPPVMPMGDFNLNMGQSLWDATMAYSISNYISSNLKKKIIHVNGRFHTDERLGIVTQLMKYNSGTKALVISTTSDDSFPDIDWSKYKIFGDYIIITDPKVPKTFKQ